VLHATSPRIDVEGTKTTGAALILESVVGYYTKCS
jgi:hypothetical protein